MLDFRTIHEFLCSLPFSINKPSIRKRQHKNSAHSRKTNNSYNIFPSSMSELVLILNARGISIHMTNCTAFLLYIEERFKHNINTCQSILYFMSYTILNFTKQRISGRCSLGFFCRIDKFCYIHNIYISRTNCPIYDKYSFSPMQM